MTNRPEPKKVIFNLYLATEGGGLLDEDEPIGFDTAALAAIAGEESGRVYRVVRDVTKITMKLSDIAAEENAEDEDEDEDDQ